MKICYSITSIFMFWFLAPRHVGSQFADQGLNPNPPGDWKVKSKHWTPCCEVFPESSPPAQYLLGVG